MENNLVAPLMHQAAKEFLSNNRDLVACVRGGAHEVIQRIECEMMLDDEAEMAVNDRYSELTSGEIGNSLSDSNPVVRDTARGFMRIEFYKQIALSFLRLTASGTLTYAIALTPEAEEQKYQIGVDAGCIAPRSAIQRQAQAQAAAEGLDAEITADWNGRLTTTQIYAKKKSNPQYGARLDQLLNEGKLS